MATNRSNIDGVTRRDATPEEVARRDGYVQGRNDENYVQDNVRRQERAAAQTAVNDSATSGLVVGFLIALLAAGIGAAVYFLGRPAPAPVAAPEVEQAPQIQREIIRERTLIERENAAPAPAPEVNVSTPETPAPEVNIINQEPAESAPAPEAPAEPETEAPATEAPVEPAN